MYGEIDIKTLLKDAGDKYDEGLRASSTEAAMLQYVKSIAVSNIVIARLLMDTKVR